MLKEIIDSAYEIFSKYRANRPLDVCTECCMDIAEEAKLASLPVGQIPVELLSNYNDSAKPEKTSIEEVKHFLPRYLELISEFNFPTHSAELSFSRLVPFDRIEWTESEFEILGIFAKEFFKHCLSIYPIPSFNDRIDTILIMFSRAKFDINSLLGIWEETDNLESILHFKDLYFNGFNMRKTKLSNSFADGELNEVLSKWIESKKVNDIFRKRIEEVILGDFDVEENAMNELNLLYNIINQRDKNGD